MKKLFWLILAVLLVLAAPAYAQKKGPVIIPGHTGTVGTQTWSQWDELSEATLQASDTFVAFFEGGVSANETGQGLGMSGVSLVLTQSGAVAAAAGSPPYRALDGTNDWFAMVFENKLRSQIPFTVIVKAKQIVDDASIRGIFYLAGLRCDKRDTKKLRIIQPVDSGDMVNSVSTAGDVYLVACRDTDGKIYFGQKTTKPTAKGDFAANDLVSIVHGTALTNNFNYFFKDEAARCFKATGVYYVVVSTKCLLTGF